MAQGTMQAKNQIEMIGAWGTYNTVGQKITLSESYKNFPYMCIRAGWDNAEDGISETFFLTDTFGVGNNIQIRSSYGANNYPIRITLKVNSLTELEIVSSNTSTTTGAIRAIYGIR